MRPESSLPARLLAPLLLAACAVSCGEPRADTPPAVSSAPAVRLPFELYGHPGPWWRDNATQGEFDKDLWHCRTVSKRVRQETPSGTRKDAAYRAFVDCMSAQAWTRGYPPRPDAAG